MTQKLNCIKTGWYRIAKTKTISSGNPKGAICKIGTSYNYREPFCSIIAITTAYQAASIENLCTTLYNSNSKHIDKIRIQFDSESKVFYLDVHYSLTNLDNTLYINFLSKDTYFEFTNSPEVTEYDTVAEVNL